MEKTTESKNYRKIDIIYLIVIGVVAILFGSTLSICISQRNAIDSYSEEINETVELLNKYIDAQAQEINLLEEQIDLLEGSYSDTTSVEEPSESYSVSQ